MSVSEILDEICEVAKKYDAIASLSVSFSGSGDSFDSFDNCSVNCRCGMTLTAYGLFHGGEKEAHAATCACASDPSLNFVFEQQAVDMLAVLSYVKKEASVLAWNGEDLMHRILDDDGRADFNNEGSCGSIVINFDSLTASVDVSQYEQVCTPLGCNVYNYKEGTTEEADEDCGPAKKGASEVDLGDFKEWLGPV